MKTLRLMLCAAVAMSCGRNLPPPESAEPPLASIHGTLQATTATTTQPVRLAVVWYSNPDSLIPSQPPAILSDEQTYQGSFPLAYRVNLSGPPPASALQTYFARGESYRRAIGLLVAYQDDGDGQLEPVGENAQASDLALGASIPDVTDWSSGSYLLYEDGAAAGVNGYQLFQHGQAVPLSTPVTISLTRAAELELFLCTQLFTWPQVPAAAGTTCAAPPAHPRLSVFGNVTRYAQSEAVYFSVTDGLHVQPTARVSLNGVALAWDPLYGGFTSDALQPASIAGLNAFSVNAGSLGTVSGSVEVPAAAQLVTPSPGQVFHPGDRVTISWTSAPAGVSVSVWDTSQSDYGPLVYANETQATSVETPALPLSGPAVVGVDAEGTRFEAPGVFVAGHGSARTSVQFAP